MSDTQQASQPPVLSDTVRAIVWADSKFGYNPLHPNDELSGVRSIYVETDSSDLARNFMQDYDFMYPVGGEMRQPPTAQIPMRWAFRMKVEAGAYTMIKNTLRRGLTDSFAGFSYECEAVIGEMTDEQVNRLEAEYDIH